MMAIHREARERRGVVNGADFVTALAAFTGRQLYGPLAFDDTQPVGPRVPDACRRPRDAALERGGRDLPDVSQFWTYGKDAFLANPVFSRDFTGQ